MNTSMKPQSVSRITCVIHQQAAEKVEEYLGQLGVPVYLEHGRTIRELLKPKVFGIPGNHVKLESSAAIVYRLTMPEAYSPQVIQTLVKLGDLQTPGRGTIFSQHVTEYSSATAAIDAEAVAAPAADSQPVHLLADLSYVTCVLSGHEAGEQLAKTALELGICVPLLTYGTSQDWRDQLGLIRITISPEKSIVHLVIPKRDSNSIIRLLAEESKLDRPGKGYIYQTQVAGGLVDTRMKVGKQSHAASIDQIIAAIDTLKMGTDWRKRLDAETQRQLRAAYAPASRSIVSIISDEGKVDDIREIYLNAKVKGAVNTRIKSLWRSGNEEEPSALSMSEMLVSSDQLDPLIQALTEAAGDKVRAIQVAGN